ncbi:MAG: hypothetical protein AAFO04_19375 [Cyanobacteria bacterium J06592_8]
MIQSKILTPQEYANLYGLTPVEAAIDLGITENSFRRYTLTTKNKINPSPQTLRTVQLLNFIRERGLEPPSFFD